MAGNTLFPSIIPGGDSGGGLDLDRIQATLENGQCPYCDDYTGDHPSRHASKAHPDEWQAYTDARGD